MPAKKAKVPVQKGKIQPKQVTAKMMEPKAEAKADSMAKKKLRSAMMLKKK